MIMTLDKNIIYFLCTGNSCRSQMAEGFAKQYLSGEWQVYSAGIEAHGVSPKAIQAMKEIGIDISNQTSDVIDRDLLNKSDLVVTLCGHANDVCPATPPDKERVYWGFDDPAQAEGTEDEKWTVFLSVRDEIGERIKRFAETGE